MPVRLPRRRARLSVPCGQLEDGRNRRGSRSELMRLGRQLTERVAMAPPGGLKRFAPNDFAVPNKLVQQRAAARQFFRLTGRYQFGARRASFVQRPGRPLAPAYGGLAHRALGYWLQGTSR